MNGSSLTRHEMASALVPSPLVYELLVPDGPVAAMAVMVWLHGGDGPARFAERTRPAFDAGWAEGALAPLAVVIPHSTRSLWLDGVGDRAAWESVLVEELLPHVRATHGPTGPAVVGGVSMGGAGALRVAFRHPDAFAAVTALEPAIEPTPVWADVSVRDRLFRDGGLAESLYGDPVDEDMFRDHHPITVAERHGAEIAAHGLAVYLECGTADALDLHQGTEALHRRLWDMGLDHEYRSVRGADHVGRSLGPRVADALRFVDRALRTPEPDPEAERLGELVRAGHEPTGFRRRSTVAGPAGPIEVHEYGDGEPVVLLPSLGRGAADFEDLALRLGRAGYRAIFPEPRGIGASTGDLSSLTMADLAADVAAVIHGTVGHPATVVGHAFGNRVARMTATEYPHLVDRVALLCCGGLVPPADEHAVALRRVFDPELSDEEHLAAVAQVFFAAGNDASVWRGGWHGVVAAVQGAATTAQPVEHWWGAGGKNLLVVQPAEDVMAVPENAIRLCEEFPDRATMVTVPGAGHALLPEQPAAVEVVLRTWLTRAR